MDDKDIDDLLKSDNQKELLVKLSILKSYDYDKFMDTMYTVFTEQGDRLVKASTTDPLEKMEALERMEEHYKDKQEFEKCAKLLELRTKIEEQIDE